jgi:outer membrane protein TolC
VLGRGLRPGSRLEVTASDRPDAYIAYEIDVEESARKAFENRPELASARQEIERRQIEVKFRNNQRLPQLDLEASIGFNGFGGTTNSSPGFGGTPRTPIVGLGRNYWGAHDTWDDAQDQSVRAFFSIPLLNKTARSNASRASIDLRKAGSQLARLEQDIIVDVRRAARTLEAAQQGIVAEEQLRAERIRLEQGESTPFDVLLREQEFVTSQSALIDAIRIYRNSIVVLDRQQGTILKTRNVMIDQVRAMR